MKLVQVMGFLLLGSKTPVENGCQDDDDRDNIYYRHGYLSFRLPKERMEGKLQGLIRISRKSRRTLRR